MTTRLLFVLVVALGIFACRSGDMRCPEPEVVKLKKSSAYKFHIFDRRQKEKVMAQSNSLARDYKRSEARHKELKDIDEWDCPRPGSHQDKVNQKRLKRIQKSAESNPRKANTTPIDVSPAHSHTN
jgi:hypothetical protein